MNRPALYVRRLVSLALALTTLCTGVLALFALGDRRPQDVPWGPLDLGDTVGRFTGRKLTALRSDPVLCHTLLDRARIGYARLPTRNEGPTCGYSDAVRVRTNGPLAVGYSPPIGASCAVAASLASWEWQVVQPAAQKHFGARVTGIEDFGTYNCRRIGGGRRPAGSANWSEHSSANAVDIAGFQLADGTRITVARDWTGTGPKAAFLRDVRDGACRLFATTLSPDYNVAHRDHLHLDQADRGSADWRACH